MLLNLLTNFIIRKSSYKFQLFKAYTVRVNLMDVVIFCGGRGTRLMERTNTVPKALVNIGDKPIIWHIMKNYSHFGHKRFVLTLGYKGNDIRKYFMNYPWLDNDFELDLSSIKQPKPKEDWRIALIDTGLQSKTERRLFLVKDQIKTERFMLTYGDGVSNIDLNALQKRHEMLHKEHGVLGTITVLNPESKFGIVKIGQHHVEDFKEKPVVGEFINAGFMIFEKDVFDFIDDSDVMLEENLLKKLASMKKLGYYHHEGFWTCMDTYKDYVTLNDMFNKGMPWKVWKD